MAYLCVICDELLTGESAQSPGAISEGDLAPTALDCGHIYHQHCIREWFEGTGGRNQRPGHGSCPKCSRISSLEGALRIFPEVESTAVVEAYEKLKADIRKLVEELRLTKEILKEESDKMEELTGQLNRKGRQFQEVVAERDILLQKLGEATQKLEEATSDHEQLRLQHAEVVDSLTNDLNEKKNIIKVMESVKAVECKSRVEDIQVIDELACTSSTTGNHGGQGQEPTPKRRKTDGFYTFTVRDREILKCLVSEERKAHPWAPYTEIAGIIINSAKYKEMISKRGTGGPSRSALEELVGDIFVKGVGSKDNASKVKEVEVITLD